MLDFFLKKFWKYRKSFGLSFFFFGAPVIYFLRDGLKLAPGSTAFTAAFTLGALLFVLPKNMFKTVYTPNVLAYWLGSIFLILSLFYLYFFCPNSGWFTNQKVSTGYIMIIFSMFLLLSTVSINELTETFVPVTFLITAVGCVCVVYFVLRNPLAFAGVKVGITLGAGDEATSNSHVFGKGGFVAALSAIVLLKKYSGFKRLVVLGGGFLGFMIMLMAQSMSTVLAFALAVTLYSYYHVSIPTLILKTYRSVWNYRFLFVFCTLFYGGFYAWDHYAILKDSYKAVQGRADRIINTLVGGERDNFRVADQSAQDRLGHIMLVFEGLEENYDEGNIIPIIFGNGYEVLYVDSPVLQSFNDFGLIGFLLYAGMLFVLIKSILSVLKNKDNEFTNLICYVFCLILVQNFTAGMVIDYPKWCYFALIARFAIPQIHYVKNTLISPAS